LPRHRDENGGGLRINKAKVLSNLYERLGIVSPIVEVGLEPHVFPVSVIDQPDPTQTQFLAWGRSTQNAVVGELGHIQLINPVGSGVIVTCELLLAFAATASLAEIRRFDTGLTTDQAIKGYRDFRKAGTPSGQVRRQTSAAALGTAQMLVRLDPADLMVQIPMDAVLDPGQGVLIDVSTANVDLSASYYWFEEAIGNL